MEIMNTQLKNLRGIINRKLGGDDPGKEDNLNNPVLLPDDGILVKDQKRS